MNEPELVLTKVFTIKDKYDKILIYKIQLLVQNSTTFEILKGWILQQGLPKGSEEKYFSVITNVVRSLIKANHNRRIYNRLSKSAEKRLKKESIKARSTVSLLYQEPDIMSEVDSFLANIKAALDSLAKSLNFIFDVKVNGLHKRKATGSNVARVVSTLKNLPKEKKEKAKYIITLLEDNSEFLSYLVDLRDSPLHKGGTANISYFKYDINTGEMLRPEIHHNLESKEDVSVFLDRTLLDIVEITQTFIRLTLSALLNDMVIGYDKKGEVVWTTGSIKLTS